MATLTVAPQVGVEAVPVDEDQSVVLTIPTERLAALVVDVIAAIRSCGKQRCILGNAILGQQPLDRDSVTRAAAVVATQLSMLGHDQVADLPTDEALLLAEVVTAAAQPLDRCTDRGCDNLASPGSSVCSRCEDGPTDDFWWQR